MTMKAIEALKSEQRHALSLMKSLSADEWQIASGCDGWRVQDVFCHMGSVFHSIADPSTIESGTTPDVEANAEVPVRSRATWSSDQVIAEYEEWSEKGIAALSFKNTPECGQHGSRLHLLGDEARAMESIGSLGGRWFTIQRRSRCDQHHLTTFADRPEWSRDE